MAMQHFNTTVPTVISSETLGTDAYCGVTEHGACLLLRQPHNTPTIVSHVLMERAEVQALYAWLTGLDTHGKLRIQPTFYPALQQGSTFGTVRVVQDDCFPDVAEWYLGSDGTFAIDRYATGQYMELSQAETLLLLTWMNGLHARGLL